MLDDDTMSGSHPIIALPPPGVMMRAFNARDADFDGVFFIGVRTTGIFCRPTCPARKPLPENVEFFPNAQQALLSGYRSCRRCHPLATVGAPPTELQAVLDTLESDPTERITDADLRARGVHPDQARRWFLRHHGMTFHAYARARRLGTALGAIRDGSQVAQAAFEHGYESLSAFNRAFRKLLGASPTARRDASIVVLHHLATPFGAMIAGATADALVLLEFADRRMLETQLRLLAKRLRCAWLPGTNNVICGLQRELAEYFAGARAAFTVPLAPVGTAFQLSVWEELQRIPCGETRSYAQVADTLNKPTAMRAVARANGANRIAILVPCHRVIGKDGSLTGYGGGLWRKKRLLELERAMADGSSR